MKQFFVWCTVLIVSLSAYGCGIAAPEHIQDVDTAMGTVIQQNLYLSDGGADCTEDILELIRRLEADTLSWREETSEVYRVNQAAGSGEGVELSKELSRAMEQCLELTENAEGAFDVALGSIVRLWNIDSWVSDLTEGEYQVPDDHAIEQALACCGSDRLHVKYQIDAQGGMRLTLYPDTGVLLDLGAAGKGLALDLILERLKDEPAVTGGIISVGGSVLTYGTKPDKTAWRVGVADPEDSSQNIGVLYLEGQWCVSTSGDYERYVESGGVRYHHILDPSTGWPADSGLRSVTIVAKEGLISDALSTACFVLGSEKGLELASKYGVEALFVETDGGIYMTPGMEDIFHGSGTSR